MPKKLPEDLTARIHSEITRHPDGVGIDDLHAVLADIVSRRTLQRRLASLVEQKRILPEGEGRSIKYRLAPIVATIAVTEEAADVVVATCEIYIPTSPEGEEIKTYVRQPIQGRKPVGYDRTLLEAYRPNETRYLPPEIREHLHNIGRSPDGERPAGTYARDILGRLLIDLSWASSRLEGNTYTRLDTKNLIELGQAAAGKDRRDAQMILNHKAAIELLVEQAAAIGFNPFTFFNLHARRPERERAAAPAHRRGQRHGVSPAGHSPADRCLFPHDPGQGRRDRRPVRASLFHHGPHSLPATVRGYEQTRLPARCQHSAY